MFANELIRSICQGCRSLSRKERCPGCTIRSWINFESCKAVAEFRQCAGHDCLGTHFHRIRIRPDPYCMLCILREPTDRNHL